MLRLLLLFLSLFTAHAAIIPKKYLEERDALVHAAKIQRHVQFVDLSESETELDQVLRKFKLEEQKNVPFIGSLPFALIKKRLESSPLFPILNSMPKGAVLHLHYDSSVSLSWLISYATYLPNCYMYNLTSNPSTLYGEFHFFESQPKDEGWQLVENLRAQAESSSKFDSYLLDLLSPPEKEFNTNIKEWDIFQNYFVKSGGLVMYKPVFQSYFQKMFYEAATIWNIQLLELRALGKGGGMYDFSRPSGFNHSEILTELESISVEVQKRVGSSFLGIRLILQGLRSLSRDDISELLLDAIEMRLQFPNLVIGFDLVGEEDKGFPLHTFVDILLDAAERAKAKHTSLPYYFHAGETNWYPDNTYSHAADNLMDAILLKTKRIGHGIALVKLPSLALKIAREKTVAVEVCPISNQELQYIQDLRNHPASILLAMGVPLTLSPDDNGPLGYDNIVYDWLLAFLSWDVDLAGLKQFAYNSLKYSSLQSEQKEEAIQIFFHSFSQWVEGTLHNFNSEEVKIY